MRDTLAVLGMRVRHVLRQARIVIGDLARRTGVLQTAGPDGRLADKSATHKAGSLPNAVQWKILAIMACAAIAIIALPFGAKAIFSHSEQDQTAVSSDPPGTFRPSREQLAALTISPIRNMVFRAETVTDGNIAIDDDLATPVFSPYSGRVTKLVAKLGDEVEKGAPLMSVAASEYVQAQNDLITAGSGFNSARAQLNLAQTNEQREHELYDAKGAALKDWQQSQSDLATAQSNFHTAEIALASVRNRLRIFGKSDREIEALERTPGLTRSSPDATVAAPIGGTVIQRQVGLGQFIQSGASSPVYTIGNLSKVWFIANVREEDAPEIHLGDPVELSVIAVPGRVFNATITYVGAEIDPNTHRLPVRADVDNPDGVLKPQMFANVTILTGRGEMKPAIPKSAVIYEGEHARIWVETPNGSLGLRNIQAGFSQGDLVEALSGVRSGEKVVVGGAIFIDRAASGN